MPWGLIVRAKGGMKTQLHDVIEANGRPLTAGQVSDYTELRLFWIVHREANGCWAIGAMPRTAEQTVVVAITASPAPHDYEQITMIGDRPVLP